MPEPKKQLYHLEYSQQRPASFDKKTPIFEKKHHYFDANNAEEAEDMANEFCVGGRTKIDLEVARRIANPIPKPRPEFLPIDK